LGTADAGPPSGQTLSTSRSTVTQAPGSSSSVASTVAGLPAASRWVCTSIGPSTPNSTAPYLLVGPRTVAFVNTIHPGT
jgi:hypothetical protein